MLCEAAKSPTNHISEYMRKNMVTQHITLLWQGFSYNRIQMECADNI